MNKRHLRLRALTEGAILIAMAEILSFLPFYKLPWGGSIDLAMLPIIVACVRWGFGPGMLVSIAHALLQTLFSSKSFVIISVLPTSKTGIISIDCFAITSSKERLYPIPFSDKMKGWLAMSFIERFFLFAKGELTFATKCISTCSSFAIM